MSRRHIAAAFLVGMMMVSAAAAASGSRFPVATGAGETSTGAPAVTTNQEPVRPGDGVSVPRVVKDVKPLYTPEAMQAKIAGSVWVDAVVLASGDVGEVTIVKSLDAEHGLDEAAIRAASQWKFLPGRRGDKAVPVLVTIEMTFTLKG